MLEVYNDYLVPEYAVCFIEYGESDSLEPEDIKSINEFLDSLPKGGTWNWGNDYGFTNNPAFGLACNTIEAEYFTEGGE